MSPVRGNGLQRDEIGDRHGAGGRVDAQLVELPEVPFGEAVAHADVDLLVAVVGPVVAEQHAIGHQLDLRADRGDVGAEAAGLLAVDHDAPFDARHRPAVAHVLEAGQPAKEAPDLVHDRLERLGVGGGDLELHRLAHRRPCLGLPLLDPDAGEVRGARADLGQDLRRRPARAPVGELQQDDADHVLVDVLAPEVNAAAGVDRLQPVDRQQPLLDLGHQTIPLDRRQIAAGVDLDLRLLRLDLREEADAGADAGVGRDRRRPRRSTRRATTLPGWRSKRRTRRTYSPVGPRSWSRSPRSAADSSRMVSGSLASGLPISAPIDGRKTSAISSEASKRRDQRDRQILHELAHHAGPEQQRQEGGERRRDRGRDRPGHALGGAQIGLAPVHALGHLAVGVLDDHRRAVDQHADREDEPEQDHDVDGEAQHAEHQQPGQERAGHREADQQRGAQPRARRRSRS